MARIRTIKPEFFINESLSKLSTETHLLAAGLLCYSDDEGYFNANPALVKAAIFPLRDTSSTIHCMLTELSNIGYIRRGSAHGGKSFGQVVRFTDHQRINRPSPSKISDLVITWDNSLSPHPQLSEDSHTERKGKEQGMEGNREPKVMPESIAKRVSDEAAILTERALKVLVVVCRREQNMGVPPEQIVRAMVDSWQDHIGSAAKLDFTYGAEKFFGENHWKDKTAWPWRKNGRLSDEQIERAASDTITTSGSDEGRTGVFSKPASW